MRSASQRRHDGLGDLVDLAAGSEQLNTTSHLIIHIHADDLTDGHGATIGDHHDPLPAWAMHRSTCNAGLTLLPGHPTNPTNPTNPTDPTGAAATGAAWAKIGRRMILAGIHPDHVTWAPLAVGYTTRHATKAQRRALAAAYQTCAHRGCRRPANRCHPTTSTTGPTAGRRTWPTWRRCARTTTTWSTNANSPSWPTPTPPDCGPPPDPATHPNPDPDPTSHSLRFWTTRAPRQTATCHAFAACPRGSPTLYQ